MNSHRELYTRTVPNHADVFDFFGTTQASMHGIAMFDDRPLYVTESLLHIIYALAFRKYNGSGVLLLLFILALVVAFTVTRLFAHARTVTHARHASARSPLLPLLLLGPHCCCFLASTR